jgi:hypothetical protein
MFTILSTFGPNGTDMIPRSENASYMVFKDTLRKCSSNTVKITVNVNKKPVKFVLKTSQIELKRLRMLKDEMEEYIVNCETN